MTPLRCLLALPLLGLLSADAPAQIVMPPPLLLGRPRPLLLPPRPRVAVSFGGLYGGGFYYSARFGVTPFGYPRGQVMVYYGRPLLPPLPPLPADEIPRRPRPLPSDAAPPPPQNRPPAAAPRKPAPKEEPGPGEPPPVPDDAGAPERVRK